MREHRKCPPCRPSEGQTSHIVQGPSSRVSECQRGVGARARMSCAKETRRGLPFLVDDVNICLSGHVTVLYLSMAVWDCRVAKDETGPCAAKASHKHPEQA